MYEVAMESVLNPGALHKQFDLRQTSLFQFSKWHYAAYIPNEASWDIHNVGNYESLLYRLSVSKGALKLAHTLPLILLS